MGIKFKHLSPEERDRIAVLRGKGLGVNEIAKQLDRDKGSISRELRRNAPPVHTGYYGASGFSMGINPGPHSGKRSPF